MITDREQIWFDAWRAAIAREGTNEVVANLMADNCLAAFDKRFPRAKQWEESGPSNV
jgi:hypothetical protein